MKKKIFLGMMLTVLTVFTSCVSEVDDVFDKPASVRVEETIKADLDILTSAANGWVMYMYGERDYGGYNVLCRFNNDGTVIVASEMADFDKTEKSHFKVTQSAGIILSFDEYNSIFHWFSDPVNPDGIGTNGRGFEGDVEFRIINASSERIDLKGKKTENNIVMVPLPANMAWKDYLNAVADAEEEMAFSQYIYEVGNDRVVMTNTDRNLFFSYEDSTGVVNKNVPFVVVPEGYILYEDLEYKGVSTDRLIYKGGDKFVFDTPSGEAKLYGQIPPATELLNDGSFWYATYEGAGSTTRELWDKARVGNQTQTTYAADFDLRYIRWVSGTLQVYNSYWGYLTMKYSTSGDQITIAYDSYGNNNANLFLQNVKDYDCVYKPFVGTFVVTSEEGRNPAWLKLTSTTDSNQTITLYKQSYRVY